MKIDINKVELKLSDTDDPIANKIEWSPLSLGGSNFKSSDLILTSADVLEIKPSRQYKLFVLAFIGIGLLFSSIGFLNIFINNFNAVFFIFAFFGIFSSFMSLKIFSGRYLTLCIDKKIGTLSVTQPKLFSVLNKNKLDKCMLFEIHALQIIGEHIQSGGGSKGKSTDYRSFELNVILKNTNRINLMDYSEIEDIRKNGEQVAGFLGIPIWDAT